MNCNVKCHCPSNKSKKNLKFNGMVWVERDKRIRCIFTVSSLPTTKCYFAIVKCDKTQSKCQKTKTTTTTTIKIRRTKPTAIIRPKNHSTTKLKHTHRERERKSDGENRKTFNAHGLFNFRNGFGLKGFSIWEIFDYWLDLGLQWHCCIVGTNDGNDGFWFVSFWLYSLPLAVQ